MTDPITLPTRTVYSAEERKGLLAGTIAVDELGNAWKRGDDAWVSTDGGSMALDTQLDLALTVLLEPAL